MTDGEESVRRARAEARRANMIIARGTLGDEVDLTPVRGAEGVALVAGVSAAAWVFAGNTLPAPWQRPLLVEFRRRGE